MTPTRTAAVIPTIGASPMLDDLIMSLIRGGVSRIWLFDNFPHDRVRAMVDDERLRYVAARHHSVNLERVPRSIYASWNDAMDRAVVHGYDVLHVLNDDIGLDPLDVHRVTEAVAASEYAIMGYDHRDRATAGPLQVHGSYRKHGVPGFAFAVDPAQCARVHPGFRWWGGDDDLFNRTEEQGNPIAVLPGAYVHHPVPSLSSTKYPLETPWHDEDRALMQELWNESW